MVFVLGIVLAIGSATIIAGRLNPVTPPQAPQRDKQPGQGGGQQQAAPMPPDHPPVELPADVKSALADLQKTAEGKPDDAEAWRHVAGAMLRAAQIEPSYNEQAEKAYRHILELLPDDLEALQGLGNVAYDQNDFDAAVGFYKKYLAKKPDDLNVLTDLGTMYLSKGTLADAVKTYIAVLDVDPKFFQAQFNLAIAYRSAGQTDAAIATMQKAVEVAPNEEAKSQSQMLLSRLEGKPAAPPAMGGGAPPMGGGAAPMGGGAPAANAAAAAPTGSFRDGVEAIFRQNPVMASKVQKIEWRDDSNAKLFLAEFPMDQMGDSMRSMFLDRMRDRLKKQKEASKVSDAVTIDFVDFASGRVMATLKE